MKNAEILPFLMNFSSEESCATRMSISPIIFLIGVHSQGAPDKAKMGGLLQDYLSYSSILQNVSVGAWSNLFGKLNNMV